MALTLLGDKSVVRAVGSLAHALADKREKCAKGESVDMRYLLSSFSFFFTLIIGALVFAALAIEFPAIMNEFVRWANLVPGYLGDLGVPDQYMVWINILITGDKLVLLGIVLVTRIVLSLVIGAFASLLGLSPVETSKSSFENWPNK